MPRKCVVPNCNHNDKKNEKDECTLFGFPRENDRKRLEEWIRASGQEDLVSIPLQILHRRRAICRCHFSYDQFIHSSKRVALKPTAIPRSIDPTIKPVSDEVLRELGKTSLLKIQTSPFLVPLIGPLPQSLSALTLNQFFKTQKRPSFQSSLEVNCTPQEVQHPLSVENSLLQEGDTEKLSSVNSSKQVYYTPQEVQHPLSVEHSLLQEDKIEKLSSVKSSKQVYYTPAKVQHPLSVERSLVPADKIEKLSSVKSSKQVNYAPPEVQHPLSVERSLVPADKIEKLSSVKSSKQVNYAPPEVQHPLSVERSLVPADKIEKLSSVNSSKQVNCTPQEVQHPLGVEHSVIPGDKHHPIEVNVQIHVRNYDGVLKEITNQVSTEAEVQVDELLLLPNQIPDKSSGMLNTRSVSSSEFVPLFAPLVQTHIPEGEVPLQTDLSKFSKERSALKEGHLFQYKNKNVDQELSIADDGQLKLNEPLTSKRELSKAAQNTTKTYGQVHNSYARSMSYTMVK